MCMMPGPSIKHVKMHGLFLYCIKAEGTWHIQQPTSDEIVVLFISKSSWPENYMKLFPQAETFEDLVDWLKQSADAPMNMELWGVEKGLYSFKDLGDLCQGLS